MRRRGRHINAFEERGSRAAAVGRCERVCGGDPRKWCAQGWPNDASFRFQTIYQKKWPRRKVAQNRANGAAARFFRHNSARAMGVFDCCVAVWRCGLRFGRNCWAGADGRHREHFKTLQVKRAQLDKGVFVHLLRGCLVASRKRLASETGLLKHARRINFS